MQPSSLFRRTHALVLLLMLGAQDFVQQAWAAESNGQDIRVASLRIDIQVNADGTYVETEDIIEQLNSSRAVEQGGQVKIPYSSSLDNFEVIEASTLKQGGQRIPVARSSIFTQDGLISHYGLTSFQDIKTTVVVFPNLDMGDSIEIRKKITRKKAMLSGIFTYARVFNGEILYSDVRINLTAPKSMPLNIENYGLGVLGPISSGDQVKWSWAYKNERVLWPEEDAIDPIMYRPRLLISSMNSYSDLAAAAAVQFSGKAQVTPAIRAAADQITRGAQTPEEQARKLFEWVARNVRYFAVVLDVGGYIPRAADEVLSTRYGDCKDHAVVLQALLAAKGISSNAALITTASIYELPKIPVLAAFDHVIVYVPSLNVYLDTNDSSVSFGSLPFVDIDKPVLLLGNATPEARTPNITAEQNVTTLTTNIVINEDGSATGQDWISATGPSGIWYGGLASALSGTDPVKFTKSILLNAGLAGEGTAAATRISNADPFRFSLMYELKDYVLRDQLNGVRPVSPMDFLGMGARGVISNTLARTLPYLCSAGANKIVMDLKFPPGDKITLPRGLNVSAAARTYVSSYSLRGNTVHIERQFTSRVPRQTCAASDYASLRQLQEAVLKDLRSEIRYVPRSVSEVPSPVSMR